MEPKVTIAKSKLIQHIDVGISIGKDGANVLFKLDGNDELAFHLPPEYAVWFSTRLVEMAIRIQTGDILSDCAESANQNQISEEPMKES
jgi:hypothetical protein